MLRFCFYLVQSLVTILDHSCGCGVCVFPFWVSAEFPQLCTSSTPANALIHRSARRNVAAYGRAASSDPEISTSYRQNRTTSFSTYIETCKQVDKHRQQHRLQAAFTASAAIARRIDSFFCQLARDVTEITIAPHVNILTAETSLRALFTAVI